MCHYVSLCVGFLVASFANDASSALENPWLLQQFVLSKGCCVVS